MHSADHAYKIRPAKRDELILWYAKQPENIRIEVHATKIKIYRTWIDRKEKKEYSQSETDYAALIAAINQIQKQITACKSENDFNLRIAATDTPRRRKSTVADKIEKDLLPLITQLVDKGLSWSQISKYIAKYHHRKISRSYLHKIYSFEKMEK